MNEQRDNGLTWIAEPTIGLRFVEREGKRVLQQKWAETRIGADGQPWGVSYTWRDVPLEIE